MVANPGVGAGPCPRLDDHEIHSDRQSWDGHPAWQAVLEQAADSGAEMAALAVVECLLREAEVTPAPPADLDDHEHRRRARVDRHEVELVATDMDVPGQDGPAQVAQPRTYEGLGGVTRDLRRRSRPGGGLAVHESIVPADAHPALSWRSPDARLGLTWRLRGRELE